MRINKYIASCGVASRRTAEEYVTRRRIKVNGAIVTDLATQVSENDTVTLDGKPLKLISEKVYIVMNKPRGYVTTCSDDRGRKTVMDLLPGHVTKDLRAFPVGRLDYDTEGLLLLTNDGDFALRIMHPSEKIEKTYHAAVSTAVTAEQFETLRQQADSVNLVVPESQKSSSGVRMADSVQTLEIVIHTGKNRQVRKMLAGVGLEVINLKRVSIGKLTLGNLKSGEYSCQDTPPKIN